MKTIELAKTASGYIVVDATSAPRDTASVASVITVNSESELRSILERFGFAAQAIDEAVQRTNETGQASMSKAG